MIERKGNSLRRVFLVLCVALFLILLPSCARSPGPSSKPLFVVGSQGVSPGKFRSPRALAVDLKTGRLYVVDRSGRIQLFDGAGKFLLQWYLPEYEQGQPVGIAIEKDGNILVNDSHYHRILRYTADGSKILASWGSEGAGPGQFTFGRDVIVDSEGYVYAGDYGGGNDRILKFTPDGQLVLEWGGCGEAPGKFQRPQGMTFELEEHGETLLVADCANHRVQRFTRGGKFLFAFGKAGGGPGEFRYPHSVAVGSDGSIYVSEWGNNRVQRFDREGHPRGFWGNGGHAEGELATPWEVVVGPNDRLYVADCGNHRVQVFQWPPKNEVHG